MNSLTLPVNQPAPVDEDLVEQAAPGHGIPSQDTNPAAQVLLTPGESERETRSALMGGGLVAGATTGAVIGVMVGGPVGVVVGATIGAVAGALGTAGAGASGMPDAARSAALPDEDGRQPRRPTDAQQALTAKAGA